jgi:hypothetical protein
MASPGARMRSAALIIAREAQRRAAFWSVQVPPSMRVEARGWTATIWSQVGPSYPNEVPRVRHPVFETPSRIKVKWVTNEYRPFLAPAAEAKADAAAAEIGMTIDDECHRLGYKG